MAIDAGAHAVDGEITVVEAQHGCATPSDPHLESSVDTRGRLLVDHGTPEVADDWEQEDLQDQRSVTTGDRLGHPLGPSESQLWTTSSLST